MKTKIECPFCKQEVEVDKEKVDAILIEECKVFLKQVANNVALDDEAEKERQRILDLMNRVDNVRL